ncbi:probable WRKY transcription factor protein 1 isoform X2 [Periplaneta americana]|uniref:probable WRKY transcription factor protein 1 isoform X2 n=1 Tax=Periplaneta americana TaxID=6978 RepID=UPI0037E8C5E9
MAIMCFKNPNLFFPQDGSVKTIGIMERKQAMECEVRALRRELEETRAALRLQTVRCRQLVAAFTTKLQEKEAEVRAGRELRDRQLGRVLRALLVLEARLRREQRHIRQQLADRDDVIRAQQLEIQRHRQADKKMTSVGIQTGEENQESQENVEESLEKSGHSSTLDEKHDIDAWQGRKPQQDGLDESTSSQEDEPTRYRDLEPSQATAFVRFKKNKTNNFGSYRPISRRRDLSSVEKCFGNQDYNRIQPKNFQGQEREFKELTNAESHDLEDSMDNSCHEDELASRDLYKDYQHNPVLECVNQILLRDQEEMETTTYRQENTCKSDVKRFSYQCHSIKEEQDEENSTDGEEEEEDEEEVGKDTESQNSDNHKPSSDKESCVEENKDTSNEPLRWSAKEKTPSPPVKAQLLEEKACLLMASQRLTIVRNLEFEELDKKDTTNESQNVSSCPQQTKNGFQSGKNQVPPALPPKPPQLGAKGLYQKKLNNARLNQNGQHSANIQHPIVNGNSGSQEQKTSSNYRPDHQDVNHNLHENSECKNLDHILKTNHQDTRAPLVPEKPRQRQILSNGSLKLALNQESMTNGHDHHQEKNNNNFSITSPSIEEKIDNLNISDFQNHSSSTRHQVRSAGSVNGKNDNQVDGHTTNRHNHEQRRIKTNAHNHTPPLKGSLEELSTPPKTPPAISKNNHCGKIRVGSSVSSLITGSSGNSIVNELTKGESNRGLVLPKVSQIVRRFEDLGTGMGRESPDEDEEDDDGNNALRRNFEEFKLEDVDMDSVGSGEDGGRPAGDGAEARAAVVQNGNSNGGGGSGGSYEHFLEATGLSQKSILTPSRMYSNHRHVLKPKDVKHRSRVLKAAAGNNGSTGPVVKYWIEPFL